MITILKKIYYVSVGLSEDLRAKSWSRKAFQISVQKSISACPVLLGNLYVFLSSENRRRMTHANRMISHVNTLRGPVKLVLKPCPHQTYNSFVVQFSDGGQLPADCWRNCRHRNTTQSSCSLIEYLKYELCGVWSKNVQDLTKRSQISSVAVLWIIWKEAIKHLQNGLVTYKRRGWF